MTPEEINRKVAERLGVQPYKWPQVGQTPDYCRDIGAAFEIVKYISKRLDPNGDIKETIHKDGRTRFVGYGFRLEHHTENTEDKWVCTLPEIVCAPPYEEVNDSVFAESESPEMAICLAFLELNDK